MKASAVVSAALKGMAKAQVEYETWSGGDWLWNAPEYMATTTIARRLYKLEGVHRVTMESNVQDALGDAGGRFVGKPNRRLNLEGRFDLVVWNSRGPRGLIEVKTNVGGYSSVRGDVEKLCTALAKAGDVRWALVVYFASFAPGKHKRAKDRLVEQTAAVTRRAKAETPRGYDVTRHGSPRHVSPDGAWTAEALEIRRK